MDQFPGTATVVVGGNTCQQVDPFGSNACDLKWDQTYHVDVTVNQTVDIVAGSTVSIDAKLDRVVPLRVTCPACGGVCEVTVPIIKKHIRYEMPPCPLSARALTTSKDFTLPSSLVPLRIGFEATVTVAGPDGASIAVVRTNGHVSPKDAEEQA